MNKFMRQDNAKCFKTTAAVADCILDQPLELERGIRQRCIIEESRAAKGAGKTFVS
jgi:hypothetical protein